MHDLTGRLVAYSVGGAVFLAILAFRGSDKDFDYDT